MKSHTIKSIRKFSFTLLFAVGSLGLTGCASYDISKPVMSFNDATAEAVTTTRQAFDSTDEIYIRRQIAETIAQYPSDHTVLANLTFTNLSPFLSPEHLQARLDILDGLQKYSESLSALAGSGQLDEFDNQTKMLANKLETFNGDIGTIAGGTNVTGAQIDALTTGVRELGRWLIIREQREAVQQTVTQMQTNVANIAAFLEADLHDLAQQNQNDYHQIVNALKLPVKEGVFTDQIALENRLQLIAETILEGKKAIAAANSLSEVEAKLAKAHKLLVDAVVQPNANFADLVKQISAECQNAKTFYDSLNKAN